MQGPSPVATLQPGAGVAYQTLGPTAVAVGAAVDFFVTGRFLFCVNSANNLAFSIRLNDGPNCTMQQGIMLKCPAGQAFQKVTIDNTNGTQPLTITLGYGTGDVMDTRVAGSIQVQNGLQIVMVQGGNTQQVSANGGARVEIEQGGNVVGVDASGELAVQIKSSGVSANVRQLGGNGGGILRVQHSQEEGASNAAVVPAGAGVTTLVAPATNVNGIWLRAANIAASGATISQLYADTAAPAATNDATKRCLLQAFNGQAANLPYPMFIPPGIGLYLAASAASNLSSINYDVL